MTTSLRQSVRSTLLANVSRSQSLPSSVASSATAKPDVLGDGISGSAMAVPPPKSSTTAACTGNTVRNTKASRRKSRLVSTSNTSNCEVKQTEELVDRSLELRDALVVFYAVLNQGYFSRV